MRRIKISKIFGNDKNSTYSFSSKHWSQALFSFEEQLQSKEPTMYSLTQANVTSVASENILFKRKASSQMFQKYHHGITSAWFRF